MKQPGLTETLFPLLAGLLIAIYLQTVTGWWLNSGRGAAYTSGALFALAVVFGYTRTGSPAPRLAALWVGAQVSLTGYLFRRPGGPGNIFPIVIMVGAIVSGASVAAGGGVAWLLARITRVRGVR